MSPRAPEVVLAWRWLKTWAQYAAVSFGVLAVIHWVLGLPRDGCALFALGLGTGDCSATSAALVQSGACLARLYLWLDYVFIASYVGTLYGIVRWSQESVAAARPDVALARGCYTILRWSAAIVLGACALVDAAENASTLAAIERWTEAVDVAEMTVWKFRLFAAAVLLAATAIALKALLRTKEPARP